jgi:HlyD family secretion protein
MGAMAAGILVVGGAGYFAIATGPSENELETLTVPAQAQNLTVRIAASGTVRPVQSVNLSPKTAGRIAKLLVEQGDRVEQGQEIALMENDDLRAQFIRAQAELAQAQARLAEAEAGTRPEEIAQAQARLVQAEARLSEALQGKPREINQTIAQLESARSRLALARARVERYRALVEEGAVTQDRYDEAFTEARNANAAVIEAEQRLEQVRNSASPEIGQLKAAVAEARFALEQLRNGTRSEEVAQLQAAVKAAEAQVASAQVQLQDSIIRAPFSGIVTQKYATEGAFVTPTTSASSTASATSTSIVALAKGLEVLANVPEADVGQIQPRQPVEIVADAFPDRVFRGRVQLVAPEAVIEQNVTSFEVRVALAPEAQEALRSGMNVDLTFLGEQLSNALVVPTVAIVTQDGETGVMVPDEDDEPTFQPVTIGPTVQDQTQILEGLDPGQRVFIDLPEDFRQENETEEPF